MQYLIFNKTDRVYAYPEPVTREQAGHIIRNLIARYEWQGYYASVCGPIPVSELSSEIAFGKLVAKVLDHLVSLGALQIPLHPAQGRSHHVPVVQP